MSIGSLLGHIGERYSGWLYVWSYVIGILCYLRYKISGAEIVKYPIASHIPVTKVLF